LHKCDDIRMKNIEFLRGIYLSSNISIKPKTKSNKLEMLKSIIRAYGMDPEKVLSERSFHGATPVHST